MRAASRSRSPARTSRTIAPPAAPARRRRPMGWRVAAACTCSKPRPQPTGCASREIPSPAITPRVPGSPSCRRTQRRRSCSPVRRIASNAASATHDQAHGGGFYQDGDTVTIRNTSFSDNNADLGGGLFQETGTATVTLSTFSSNTADVHGGAVAVDGGLQESNTRRARQRDDQRQHRRRRWRGRPRHRQADFTRRDHRAPPPCDRDRQHQRRRPARAGPLRPGARDGQQHHRRAGERRRLRDHRGGKPHEQRRQSRERHELRLHRNVRPAVGRRSRPRRARQLRRPDPHPRPPAGLARH